MITNKPVYGQRTVGTTAVQLNSTASIQVRGTSIVAFATNSGVIYIGDDSSVTSSTGFPLVAGNVVPWPTNDISSIWVISDTASQKVGYVGA